MLNMISQCENRVCIIDMLVNNYGRILHIASIAGKEGNAGMLAHSASRAAVIGMTKVQGKKYAESNIISNENSFSTGFTFDLPGGRATY